MVEHTTVLSGETSYGKIVDRLAGFVAANTPRNTAANAVYAANGGRTLRVGEVIHYDPAVLPKPTTPPVDPPPGTGDLQAVARSLSTSNTGCQGSLTDSTLSALVDGRTYTNLRFLRTVRIGRRTTLQNCAFVAPDSFQLLDDGDPTAGNILDRCTFDSAGLRKPTVDTIGAFLTGATYTRCLFRNSDNYARSTGNCTFIECLGIGATANAPSSHVDGVEVYGGENTKFVDSRFEITINTDSNGMTAAINATADFGKTRGANVGMSVLRCIIEGGGAPLLVRNQGYSIDGKAASATNVVTRGVAVIDTELRYGRWKPINRDGVVPAGTYAAWSGNSYVFKDAQGRVITVPLPQAVADQPETYDHPWNALEQKA